MFAIRWQRCHQSLGRSDLKPTKWFKGNPVLAKNFKKSLLAVNIGLAMGAGFSGVAVAADSEVQAKSKIIKQGKSIAFTKAEMFQNGNLIATSTATNKLV